MGFVHFRGITDLPAFFEEGFGLVWKNRAVAFRRDEDSSIRYPSVMMIFLGCCFFQSFLSVDFLFPLQSCRQAKSSTLRLSCRWNCFPGQTGSQCDLSIRDPNFRNGRRRLPYLRRGIQLYSGNRSRETNYLNFAEAWAGEFSTFGLNKFTALRIERKFSA